MRFINLFKSGITGTMVDLEIVFAESGPFTRFFAFSLISLEKNESTLQVFHLSGRE